MTLLENITLPGYVAKYPKNDVAKNAEMLLNKMGLEYNEIVYLRKPLADSNKELLLLEH